MRLWSTSMFVIGLPVCTGIAAAQQTDHDSLRTHRLAAVGRLWGVVKYFHPAFLTRDVPWDSATVAAIARVHSARSRDEYAAAVGALLRVIRDRNTSVRESAPPPVVTEAAHSADTRLTTRWETDSTLVIRIPCCFQESARELQQAAALIARARRVVFDLRGPTPSIRGEADDEFSEGIDALLANGTIAAPTVRQRMHLWYRGAGSDAVGTTQDAGGLIYRGRPGNPSRRVGFVVYADSDLPSIAWALQAAGQGEIVLDASRGSRLQPDPYPQLFPVDLGEGLIADVRVVDVVGQPDGWLSPDTVIATTGPVDRPLQVALDRVRRPLRSRPRQVPPSHVLPRPDDDFAAMRFPDLAYRVLAGYRYWNAVHYFYPSAMPAGTDWDDVLAESVQSLEQARDTLEYWLAINAMTRRLADGHAQTVGIAPYVTGRAGPRVLLRYIENRVVVTRVMPDSATMASGIRVGDVILRVDGEDVEARIARIKRVVAGTSRPGEPNGPPLNQLLFGNPGSPVRLAVERGDGTVHEIALSRVIPPCLPASCAPRPGEPIRFLTRDVGYADLFAITESMVDSLFEMFKDTRAIIFDGRGRNAGAPPAIAARLANRPRFVAGRSRRPIVMSPDPDVRRTREGSYFLESSTKPRYRGKTVLLIDDRAFSNAEQVAFFFAGANGTTLIGSPTAGGVGGLTNVRLPGGIVATFPGSEALLSDGRPMIRVGVPPDILVRPTIGGVRAGRDEVLERALTFLGIDR